MEVITVVIGHLMTIHSHSQSSFPLLPSVPFHHTKGLPIVLTEGPSRIEKHTRCDKQLSRAWFGAILDPLFALL